LIALGATPLQSWSSNHLGRPGYGIAVAVNVLLPLGTLLVSLWHPRILIAALGGPLLVFCFVFVRLLLIEPRFWSWSVPFIVNRTSPIELAAAVACSVVGAVSALAISPWRRVGLPDQADRCPTCGYLLRNIEDPLCPECGRQRG